MVICTSLAGRRSMMVRFYEAFRISQTKELYSGNSINRKGGGTPRARQSRAWLGVGLHWG